MDPKWLQQFKERHGAASAPLLALVGVFFAHSPEAQRLTPTLLTGFPWIQPGSPLRFSLTSQQRALVDRDLPPRITSAYSEDFFKIAWAQVVERAGPPKLAINIEKEPPAHLGAFAEWLMQAALQTSAVYIEAGTDDPRWSPQWPLDLASLPSPAQRRRVEELISDLPDGTDQARWQPLGGTTPVDGLFVPRTVTFVPGAAGIQARSLGASALALAFAPPKTSAARAMAFGLRLRFGMDTGAVAVIRASASDRDDFCLAFMAELSRGRSLSEAVTQAGREYLQRPPFLLTSSTFAERFRLPPRDEARSFDNLRKLSDDLGRRPERRVPDLPPNLALTLGLKQPAPTSAELAGAVRDFLVARGTYGTEGIQATYAKLRRSVRKAEPPTSRRPRGWGAKLSTGVGAGVDIFRQRHVPRHLHANVVSTDIGEEAPVFQPLRAGASYRVDVRLGPANEDSNFLATPFPEEHLPPSPEGHTLTVAFADLSSGRPSPPPPKSAQVHLGPSGPSSTCSFPFIAPETGQRFAARILVMHRNRILQTALLSAPVVDPKGKDSVPGGVRLELELTPTSHLERLEERTAFDAALVVNHDLEGTARLMGVEGQDIRWIQVGSRDLETTVQDIKNRLARLTREEDRPQELGDPRLIALLIMLANQGRLLWEQVIDSPRVALGLRHGHRIQVLEAKWSSFLPVELFYEFPAPNPNARLCPDAARALREGRCTASHHRDDEAAADYVCPLGFWGLTRIIERQDASEDAPATGEVGLRPMPPPRSHEIPLLSSGVIGASHRVDEVAAGSVSQLMQVLQTLWPDRMQLAKSWNAWRSTVQRLDPSLLVLVVHTATDETTELPTLEIADESLGLMQLRPAHLRSSRARDGVLVLLMGCSTALPRVRSQSFVPRILKHSGGSAVVVSSIAELLGRHAAPTTATLLERLSGLARPGPIEVGKAFLRLRQELLAQGDPLVLCLTLYGDTDWKLVAPTGDLE
ncbi:hypothetical protein OV207_17470 [Corallococcus sp. BB11-1]|uniref:hypothetical protein n=1 Tax=Corallococcus sp. BB11-1 TaxID=2996783 RepID=UPI00226E7023|nr:hypothetical protein [Corallococcus sp. BB11-1]MCY1033248.1 hypothetical protein [Corallococcus sp. BB11-1]